MTAELHGQTIAFLTANSGVEQDELNSSWNAVARAGGTPRLISPEGRVVQAYSHDVEKADIFAADLSIDEADPGEFDALILPGGTTNADQLRLVPGAVDFVKAFVRDRKPIASICQGPSVLVEADVVRGKTLTSLPSLRTDIVEAGGRWLDEEVFVCHDSGWTLVTSREPDDLPAFNSALVKAFSST